MPAKKRVCFIFIRIFPISLFSCWFSGKELGGGGRRSNETYSSRTDRIWSSLTCMTFRTIGVQCSMKRCSGTSGFTSRSGQKSSLGTTYVHGKKRAFCNIWNKHIDISLERYITFCRRKEARQEKLPRRWI